MIPADWKPEGQWELSHLQLYRLAHAVLGKANLYPNPGAVQALVDRFLWEKEQDGETIRPDDDDDQADELPRQYKGTWSWEEETE